MVLALEFEGEADELASIVDEWGIEHEVRETWLLPEPLHPMGCPLGPKAPCGVVVVDLAQIVPLPVDPGHELDVCPHLLGVAGGPRPVDLGGP